MPEKLKIPYEKGSFSRGAAPIVQFYKENRDRQMKYTRHAVSSKAYREWMTQLTEAELNFFIETNKKRLLAGLEYKTFGPSLQLEYFWRNALYELELLYRSHGPELSNEIHEQWQEETVSDLSYWNGKYEVARSEWQQKKGVVAEEKASYVTPYY